MTNLILKMKNLSRLILKRIWHDVYLAVSFTLLRPLAMTCRQATDFRNTQFDQAGKFARTKYYLHLSICSACSNYLRVAEYFERSLADYEVNKMSEDEVEKFNRRLMSTFQQT